jgi:flagellar hook assembly protein FlgD
MLKLRQLYPFVFVHLGNLYLFDEPYVKTNSHNDSAVTLTLFPNPSSGSLTLSLSGKNNSHAHQITITDIKGRVVYQLTNNSNTTHNINLSGQPSGLYIAIVQLGDQIYKEKIVLTR